MRAYIIRRISIEYKLPDGDGDDDDDDDDDIGTRRRGLHRNTFFFYFILFFLLETVPNSCGLHTNTLRRYGTHAVARTESTRVPGGQRNKCRRAEITINYIVRVPGALCSARATRRVVRLFFFFFFWGFFIVLLFFFY
jgi:hypothetical protein